MIFVAFCNTPFHKSVLSSVDNASKMLNMGPYRPRPTPLLKSRICLG